MWLCVGWDNACMATSYKIWILFIVVTACWGLRNFYIITIKPCRPLEIIYQWHVLSIYIQTLTNYTYIIPYPVRHCSYPRCLTHPPSSHHRCRYELVNNSKLVQYTTVHWKKLSWTMGNSNSTKPSNVSVKTSTIAMRYSVHCIWRVWDAEKVSLAGRE